MEMTALPWLPQAPSRSLISSPWAWAWGGGREGAEP